MNMLMYSSLLTKMVVKTKQNKNLTNLTKLLRNSPQFIMSPQPGQFNISQMMQDVVRVIMEN